LVMALLEAGDIVGVDREIDAFARGADELRQPLYRWYVPLWKGMRALMAGDQETGVTIIELVEELDAGPIAAQERFAVGIAGEGHLAAGGEGSEVRGLPSGSEAGLTEGGDGDEHNAAYDATQFVEADTEFIDLCRGEVLDDDVGFFDHGAEQLKAGRRLDV